MNVVPYSYSGVLLNDTTNYNAFFPQAGSISLQASSEPIEVVRPYLPPDFAIKKLSSKITPLTILMRGTIASQLDSLKKLFDTRDQTPRLLVVTDANDGNRRWQVLATCVSHSNILGATTTFNLYIEDDRWYTSIQNTSTWSVTASGQQTTVSPIGNAPAQPIISITPTGGSIGFQYKRYITTFNNTDLSMTNYPLSIVGSLDTASIVTAGKMQSSGNDLRVVIDGVEANRWLGSMNTAATKVWCSISFSPRIEMVTTAAISTTGLPATLKFAVTTFNQNRLRRLSSGELFLLDSEIVVCGQPNVVNCSLPILERGEKGTTAATHLLGITAKWVEHDIWIKYGNSTIGAPDTDDTAQPIFSLSSSTNTLWSYSGAFSSSSNPARTGDFFPSVPLSTSRLSQTYTATQGTFADPSSVLGCTLLDYLVGAVWKSENGQVQWTIYNPCGFTAVTSTGKKFTSKTGLWPSGVGSVVGLQQTLDGTNYTSLWSEVVPTAGSWTSWSNPSTSLTGVPRNIRFVIKGSIPAAISGQCAFEVGSASLTINSATSPTVTVSSEYSNYSMDCTLTNVTTGDYITFTYPMKFNQTVVINCLSKTVVMSNASRISSLVLSTPRVQWFDLLPGTNTLQFDQDSTSAVTVVVAWQDRNP